MARLLLLLLVAPVLLCAGQTHDDIAGKPELVSHDPAKDLPGTRIVPVLDTPHEDRMNLLYCATDQLAWNSLMEMAGGPVKLAGNPPLAKRLNEKKFDASMIDAASVYVFAGSGPDVPQRIREGLKKHFGGTASPKLVPVDVAPGDLVNYSYLFKNLAFAVPFHVFPYGMGFDGKTVRTFGVGSHVSMRKGIDQVHIHDYRSDDDFVVELRGTGTDDRMLVAEISPAVTLEKTVESVLERLDKTKRDKLEDRETLVVPGSNFEIIAHTPELENRSILNPSFPPGARLQESIQLIRFKMDEYGAVLKSEKRIGTKGSAEFDDEVAKPRYFVCNKSHLILMLRKDQKKPYFAMWIANAELLSRVPESATPAPTTTPATKSARRGSVGSSNIDD